MGPRPYPRNAIRGACARPAAVVSITNQLTASVVVVGPVGKWSGRLCRAVRLAEPGISAIVDKTARRGGSGMSEKIGVMVCGHHSRDVEAIREFEAVAPILPRRRSRIRQGRPRSAKVESIVWPNRHLIRQRGASRFNGNGKTWNR